MGKARKGRGFRTSKNVKGLSEPKNEGVGLCITDLPRHICIDILVRLPLSCVLICLCVCKTWRNMIKDSEFVKLHFSRAEAYPLIRPVGPTHISRTLYFVDQPPKYDYLNMKLGTKLKIPLHNDELATNGEGEGTRKLHSKRKRATKLRPDAHKLNLVNFCNGFLCLSEPFHNEPVMVCNPITGEFIKIPLPIQSYERTQLFVVSGLGFCPKTNRYKVVRMFSQETREKTIDPVTGKAGWWNRVAEIHTLGTTTWRAVGYAPSLFGYQSPTYLNGTLNSLLLPFDDSSVPYYIASFDFSEENFQSIPKPPKRYDLNFTSRIRIGELRGCLCVSDASDVGIDKIELWVMKTYGVESSWEIQVKIDISTLETRALYGSYEPISYFKDGTLLLFHSLSKSMFCFNPEDKKLRVLKVCGYISRFEAISYIPNFISLKEAIIGDDVEVYDVKLRCGGLKVLGESRVVSLVDKSVDLDL